MSINKCVLCIVCFFFISNKNINAEKKIYLGLGRVLMTQSSHSLIRHTGVDVGLFEASSIFFYEISGLLVLNRVKRSELVNLYSNSYLINFCLGLTYKFVVRIRTGFSLGTVFEHIKLKFLEYNDSYKELNLQTGGLFSLALPMTEFFEVGLRAGCYHVHRWRVTNWYYSLSVIYKL